MAAGSRLPPLASVLVTIAPVVVMVMMVVVVMMVVSVMPITRGHNDVRTPVVAVMVMMMVMVMLDEELRHPDSGGALCFINSPQLLRGIRYGFKKVSIRIGLQYFRGVRGCCGLGRTKRCHGSHGTQQTYDLFVHVCLHR
jgi:uncharacterized membrane protein YhhN